MLHSRMARVAEEIKQHIGEIIDREIHDPKVPSMVTVSSVKVAKDLHVADVHVSFLGDEDAKVVKEAMSGLNKAAGFIRAELGRRIVLKYIPHLRFHYNASTRYALELEKVFQRIAPSESPASGEGDATAANEDETRNED